MLRRAEGSEGCEDDEGERDLRGLICGIYIVAFGEKRKSSTRANRDIDLSEGDIGLSGDCLAVFRRYNDMQIWRRRLVARTRS